MTMSTNSKRSGPLRPLALAAGIAALIAALVVAVGPTTSGWQSEQGQPPPPSARLTASPAFPRARALAGRVVCCPAARRLLRALAGVLLA